MLNLQQKPATNEPISDTLLLYPILDSHGCQYRLLQYYSHYRSLNSSCDSLARYIFRYCSQGPDKQSHNVFCHNCKLLQLQTLTKRQADARQTVKLLRVQINSNGKLDLGFLSYLKKLSGPATNISKAIDKLGLSVVIYNIQQNCVFRIGLGSLKINILMRGEWFALLYTDSEISQICKTSQVYCQEMSDSFIPTLRWPTAKLLIMKQSQILQKKTHQALSQKISKQTLIDSMTQQQTKLKSFSPKNKAKNGKSRHENVFGAICSQEQIHQAGVWRLVNAPLVHSIYTDY